MGDSPRHPEAEDTGGGDGRGPATGTPRWVSMLGITVAAALIVLIVVLHLTGIIGPGSH
jgi:hypothetical protein